MFYIFVLVLLQYLEVGRAICCCKNICIIIDYFISILLEILDYLEVESGAWRVRLIDPRGLKSRSYYCRNLYIGIFIRSNIGSKRLEQFQRGIINWYFETNTARHLLNNSRVVAIVSVFNIYFAGVIDSHGFHRPPRVLTSQLNQTN